MRAGKRAEQMRNRNTSNTRRHQHQTGRGFGLVEVLVVIVIIGILAVLLLPRLLGTQEPGKAVAKAINTPKGRAKQVAGAEYQGQINMAIQMYRQDHEDQNPQTLSDLKPYGVTDAMIVDPNTKEPVPYDPKTGKVGKGDASQLLGGGALPQIGN